jgi:hypothetical protein
MVQVCLIGGLWYLVVSFILKFSYKRPESVTIRYTSSYWWIPKIKSYVPYTKRRVTSTLNKASFFNIKLTKSTRLSEKHYLP